MTITNNWADLLPQLAKSRQVIAVELQGHGRTVDINRDFSHENLADDVAALLDYLKIPRADLLGYSMGGGVALQVAIRHPQKVRKVVSVSAVFRHDGWVQEALDAFPCDEIFGDMRPRAESRLAILPDTTHVTLMGRAKVIVPMVNDFLDAQPQGK